MRNKKLFVIFGILLAITFLVAVGSAVFSIREVKAYCLNALSEETDDAVIEIKDAYLGMSIFAVDEDRLAREVEGRVSGIKIVTIERFFPNRISINYVKLYEYFQIKFQGGYYVCSVDGKIISIDKEPSDLRIEIKMDVDENLNPGDQLTGNDMDALLNMIDMLERLDYREVDAAALIKTIDFTVSKNLTYIVTRTGVVFKILDRTNIGTKLHYALSVYVQKPENRVSGMYIVVNTQEVFYNKTSDY